MADYKGKIRKLLSLAGSPNEHEAKAALLKARALMAEHKLTEKDFEDGKEHEVKHIVTDVTFSARRRMWYSDLAGVVAKNYCCHFYVRHQKGKQTMTACFAGLDDDVEVCAMVFDYAMESALSEVKKIEKRYRGYENAVIKATVDSYGRGFAEGLEAEYEKQYAENEENGWALVVATPPEVLEETSGFGNKTIRMREQRTVESEYSRGYEDGKNFKPDRRLAETEAADTLTEQGMRRTG